MCNELLPCPFCGTVPDFPDGDGTQYEIECNDCGQAVSSIQISDLMTIEERLGDDFQNEHRYSDEYIERAKKEAVNNWNKRKSTWQQGYTSGYNDGVLDAENAASDKVKK